MVRTSCPRGLGGGGNARVQNGVSGRYTHAVFELVAHEESMIWTSRSYTFAKEGLLQLPG